MLQHNGRNALDIIIPKVQVLREIPYRIMIIYGPPNCGKSTLARDIAMKCNLVYVDFLDEVLTKIEPEDFNKYDKRKLVNYIRDTITRSTTGAIIDELEGLFATWQPNEIVSFFGNLNKMKVNLPGIIITSQMLDYTRIFDDSNRIFRLG